ncbi:hypothetical protein RchiOBHm_Chr6g0308341 [Rosa chinensis]|uniref:Uncharacterized protein n=1 Tax=Rosa chinensis TaxID=74649 RepID=A0A2P6Q0L1_ROSCH|nr:hypothetical protein RchiOBHm_Chr6g0308341 [Rosa chinensis]
MTLESTISVFTVHSIATHHRRDDLCHTFIYRFPVYEIPHPSFRPEPREERSHTQFNGHLTSLSATRESTSLIYAKLGLGWRL